MATVKQILQDLPRRLFKRDVASPQCSREDYHATVKAAVDELWPRISQKQASLLTEALYAAYQMGASHGKPLMQVFAEEEAAKIDRDTAGLIVQTDRK